MQLLVCRYRNDVEQRVLYVPAEDVSRHVLCRRHIFEGRFGKNLTRHLRLSKLHQKAVFDGGVDFKGVPQTHLLLGDACKGGKLLVEKLRGEHGVRFLYGVGGGQIVVLARVDNDSRISVDDARKELVYYGALHVYVAV